MAEEDRKKKHKNAYIFIFYVHEINRQIRRNWKLYLAGDASRGSKLFLAQTCRS